jgi:hypothetical protein
LDTPDKKNSIRNPKILTRYFGSLVLTFVHVLRPNIALSTVFFITKKAAKFEKVPN